MNALSMVACLILPVVFNVVYFLIGFTPMACRWVTWAVINISIIMVIVAGIPYYGKREAIQIGPAVLVALRHLAIQFVVGLIFLIISAIGELSWKVPLIVHLCIGVVFLILAIGMRSADLHTAKVQQEAQAAHNIILSISDELMTLWRSMPEGKDRKIVERLYDSSRTLRVDASSPNEDVDIDIIRSIEELKIAVRENNGTLNDVANRLQGLFDRRNLSVAKKQTGR